MQLGVNIASVPHFPSLFHSLPSSQTHHKSLKHPKDTFTHTSTHTHKQAGKQAETHKTHIPELVCEILRLIEEEECDLVTPGCGEGYYKCVYVCE